MTTDVPLVIAAFGEGDLDRTGIKQNSSSVGAAGWTTVLLGLFHPHADGNIFFNKTENLICKDGDFMAGSWMRDLHTLQESNGNGTIELIASFGGGGVGDFTNIKNIYEANGESFAGTNLERNIKAFADGCRGVITAIDMDDEETYDAASFVAFCQLVRSTGLHVTFCPYECMDFWIDALQKLQTGNESGVLRFNLQCYQGGADNSPTEWATAIQNAVPGFDTDRFILVSTEANQNAAGVQAALARFSGDACVGGAFLWTLDMIIQADNESQSSYVEAIRNALQ